VITRQKLYALGETFGECATQVKPGGHGRLYGGASSASTSKSTNTTDNISNTTTQDRRVVADSGAGVVNADKSNVNLTVQSLDGGAVTAGVGAANNAVNQTAWIANNAVSTTAGAFQHLADVGASMLNANTALANSINTSGMNEVTTLASDMTGMMQTVLSGAATNQATAAQLALQPAAQQNPDRYLLLGALAIVAIVAFQRKGAL
jgi:hypothetical protein